MTVKPSIGTLIVNGTTVTTEVNLDVTKDISITVKPNATQLGSVVLNYVHEDGSLKYGSRFTAIGLVKGEMLSLKYFGLDKGDSHWMTPECWCWEVGNGFYSVEEGDTYLSLLSKLGLYRVIPIIRPVLYKVGIRQSKGHGTSYLMKNDGGNLTFTNYDQYVMTLHNNSEFSCKEGETMTVTQAATTSPVCLAIPPTVSVKEYGLHMDDRIRKAAGKQIFNGTIGVVRNAMTSQTKGVNSRIELRNVRNVMSEARVYDKTLGLAVWALEARGREGTITYADSFPCTAAPAPVRLKFGSSTIYAACSSFVLDLRSGKITVLKGQLRVDSHTQKVLRKGSAMVLR